METLLESRFIMKYDFNQNIIKQYSTVKFIASNNDSCLVEDIETKNRLWIMKSYIKPIDNEELEKIWAYYYS
jgi:hypothetical protein